LQAFSEIGLKPCKMIGKTDKTPQLNMYQVPLLQFINKDHELYILAERINWDELEQDLSDSKGCSM
jgi:3'-phosphoadenosine 5'-phosphosulfate sulfotransferase (PAPS reductase)/FAD synthetase